MDYFVLDWETYYDSKAGYSLKKMTTEEYINDPRFHTFGFSISKNGGTPRWVPEDKIEFMLRQLKLHEHAVIAHNASFDMAILNWKYGVKPKFIVDTLAMARGVFGNEESLSLDSLSEKLGLGKKGDAVVHMDGVRNPSTTMLHRLGEYAVQDAALTWKLWEYLKTDFPKSELVIIDITTRMFTEPSFVLDKAPIKRELELGEIKKQKLLEQANCTMADLRSDEKFASLLQNLGVDPPKKLSAKKTAKAGHSVYTWAFAKSDVDFKALGDHENELVRWAVEARLGLKSTIKQSRAERFLGIAERMGVMPVALTYYGAGTGRYAASSSAKVNMQNLPALRGSKDPDAGLLRKSLKAPPGHVVVVSDASQIEARLVAWQAGQTNVVEAFAGGRDVYSEMASVIFGRHVDRKKNPDDYVAGFIGKCVVLGCLGPDTQVLTDSGWKSIVKVKVTDRVWDGEEWVCHSGVINKGEKEVARGFGLTATMDHEILTEHGWREWSEVLENRSLFQSAISKASLPSPIGYESSGLRGKFPGGIQLFSAHVVALGRLIDKISSPESQPVATSARKPPATIPGSTTGGTKISCRMKKFASVFSTAFHQSYLGALSKLTHSIITTVGAGSKYFTSGLRTERNFSSTSCLYKDILRQGGTSTESTTTRGMSQGIYGSQQNQRMSKIEGESETCRERSMTYDIAFSGPRNRFTVATNAGPIIVHNCGYGLGHIKFAAMIYAGMLGGPSTLFDDKMVDELGVNVNAYSKYLQKYPDNIERLRELKPAGLDAAVWIRHAACAKHIIDTFRDSNRAIPEYWKTGEELLTAMYRGTGEKIGLFLTAKNKLLLPNGMWLHFKDLEKGEDGYTCIRKKEGRIKRVKVYGGSVVENLSQALAGAYVKEAMVRMYLRGHRTILQVHDEVVVIAPEDKAEETLRVVNECMETAPSWAVGLPLAAEGDFAPSYGEAK